MRILSCSLYAALLVGCGSSDRNDPAAPDAPVQHHFEDAPPQMAESSRVYAHSGTTLYRIDTANLAPVMIGTMAGLGTESLTDIAIDKNDHMVGITMKKLYAIDATNGAVTLVKDLSQSATGFTSLSYVPTDLSDPNSDELLVAANGNGDVFKIDPATGNATMLGNYGMIAAQQVRSSGDIVAVRDLGIYATVDVGDDPNQADFLAKIDPVTGKATPLGTGTGFTRIFGLGYWAGTFYGFVDNGTGMGKMITIDQNTGAGSLITAGPQQWYGAGVTTDAPILQ
ncbi:MAG: hypothetical protein ABI678_11675 [Kofleriaceae bacterium]